MSFNVAKFTRWLPERRWGFSILAVMGLETIAGALHLYSPDRVIHLVELYIGYWLGAPLVYWWWLSPAERTTLTLHAPRYLRIGYAVLLYLASLFYFMDRAGPPTNAFLLEWCDTLDLYAKWMYVGWCLWLTFSGLFRHNKVVVNEWLITTLGFGWAWVFFRWVLSRGATMGMQIYATDPALFYRYCGITLLGLGLVAVTRKVSQCLLGGGVNQTQGAAAGALGGISTPLRLTKMDKKRIACHEAGHALVYAAITPFPEHLSIHCFGMHNGIAGYVRGPAFPHQFPPVQVETFQMLLDLAGKEAEWVLLNEISSGNGESATSDEAKWLARAKGYLSQQTDQIFYIDPQSSAEAAFNATRLNSLRGEQKNMLREFMAMNRAVLLQMVTELEQEGCMNNARLREHLKSVVLPDYFPRVQQ